MDQNDLIENGSIFNFLQDDSQQIEYQEKKIQQDTNQVLDNENYQQNYSNTFQNIQDDPKQNSKLTPQLSILRYKNQQRYGKPIQVQSLPLKYNDLKNPLQPINSGNDQHNYSQSQQISTTSSYFSQFDYQYQLYQKQYLYSQPDQHEQNKSQAQLVQSSNAFSQRPQSYDSPYRQNIQIPNFFQSKSISQIDNQQQQQAENEYNRIQHVYSSYGTSYFSAHEPYKIQESVDSDLNSKIESFGQVNDSVLNDPYNINISQNNMQFGDEQENDFLVNFLDDDSSSCSQSTNNSKQASRKSHDRNRLNSQSMDQSFQGASVNHPVISEDNFPDVILKEINTYYKQEFVELKDALTYYKSYIYQNNTKMQLNYKMIGEQFGWDKKMIYQKFDGLQQKYLNKYDASYVNEVKQLIIKQYNEFKQNNTNISQKELNEIVKKDIVEKIQLNTHFDKNQRQMVNIINYQLKNME